MKYTGIIFLLTAMFCGSTLRSQQVPMWETALYFEDAKGNRDTLTVGYDPEATPDIDSQFGEQQLFTPFDSVFDVRGTVPYTVFGKKLSKRIINVAEKIHGSSHDCWDGARVWIFIWAKYQPVTVRWDLATFVNDPCVKGSVITNHYADELVDPYYDWDEYPPNLYFCAGGMDSITVNTSEQFVHDTNVSFPIFETASVAGIGDTTIYGLRFITDPIEVWWTPCHGKVLVGTEEIERAEELRFFPNPTHTRLSLGLPFTAGSEARRANGGAFEAKIYSTTGRLLRQQAIREPELDVSALPSGAYFLVLEGEAGQSYVGKFVKM